MPDAFPNQKFLTAGWEHLPCFDIWFFTAVMETFKYYLLPPLLTYTVVFNENGFETLNWNRYNAEDAIVARI